MSPASGNKKIRVLIVDDSSFMRVAIRGILGRDPSIEIIGTAIDGVEGVEKTIALKPDIVTMDVEMPRMDGIAAVKEIMAKAPTRVLMVSSLTTEGATATFDALDAGAIDYVPKNPMDTKDAQGHFRDELLRKVKEGVQSTFAQRTHPAPPHRREEPALLRGEQIVCVGIGASTGGPVALQEVLSRIPASFPHAIVVAIHMPKAFTGPFADRLNNKCSLNVREAVDGDRPTAGTALISPGGLHTLLAKDGNGLSVRLVPTKAYPEYVYVPSVDLMIGSMAEATGGKSLGVILTGMGSDGLKGMRQLKGLGGMTIAQDEATSTIFGMPRACIEAGITDVVLPLGQIGPEMAHLAK